MARPIQQIAADIAEDWADPGYAGPYLQAMMRIRSIDDWYGADDGESIVMYFLTNAGKWKGAKAREIKKELRDLLRASNRRASAARVVSAYLRGAVR